MIAGKRYHGLQSDIWSAGVVFYAMVAGYLPFEDPDTNIVYKKILSGKFEIANWVSKPC
jgi:5'-AMP-activated protein kinase catalytic alpha subunit